MDEDQFEAPVRVAVYAPDPITEAGLNIQVNAAEGIDLTPWAERDDADVLVFSAAELTKSTMLELRRLAAEAAHPVVLVIDKIDETGLIAAVVCRVVAVLPRVATTGERLAHAVRNAATGGGVLPPNMIGELLKHLERLQREVLDPLGRNNLHGRRRLLGRQRWWRRGLLVNWLFPRLSASNGAYEAALWA